MHFRKHSGWAILPPAMSLGSPGCPELCSVWLQTSPTPATSPPWTPGRRVCAARTESSLTSSPDGLSASPPLSSAGTVPWPWPSRGTQGATQLRASYVHWFCGRTACPVWVQILLPLLMSDLGQLPYLSKPRVLPLSSGDSNYPRSQKGSEVTHVRYLAQCLAHRQAPCQPQSGSLISEKQFSPPPPL